jgi:hypothetical protein
MKNKSWVMQVRNWVPVSNIISYQNVPDEDLTVLSMTKLPENVIKWIYYYYQRAVFSQFFPWDNISLVLNEISANYLAYLRDITWKIISKWNFINFSGKNIQQLAKEIEAIKKLSSYSLLPFISVKTAQELGSLLNNRWIWVPNLWKEKAVEQANSKAFLRSVVGNEYMVKWEILYTKDDNFKNKLLEILSKNGKNWIWTIVRIPRSASGLWIRFLVKEKTNNDIQITPDELVTVLNHIKVDKILIENKLPSWSFKSPNVVWYINPDGKIEIFWVTDQLLINNVHQWNVYNPGNKEVYEKLSYISKNVLKKYYEKLWVVWYFWVDFLLVEASKLDNPGKFFSEEFKWKFSVNWKEYFAPIVEVNFRINGGMPLSWLRNLDGFNVKNKYSAIINTLELKEGIDVISILNKNNLLFDNGKDYSSWVVIVTILPGKLQYIVIANNEEEFKKINNKVKNLLAK